MTRTDLINKIIEHRKEQCSYLEIGLQNADNNFNKVKTPIKTSVDPDPKAKAHIKKTSDDFFNHSFTKAYSKFDIIFIDGLHHADQVERDIANASRYLYTDGVIILHDCNPPEEWHQLVPRQHKVWYGDVWRAFVGFRQKYPHVQTCCIDADCGLGIIWPQGEHFQTGFSTNIPFAEFSQNRNQLLGLITPEEFDRLSLHTRNGQQVAE